MSSRVLRQPNTLLLQIIPTTFFPHYFGLICTYTILLFTAIFSLDPSKLGAKKGIHIRLRQNRISRTENIRALAFYKIMKISDWYRWSPLHADCWENKKTCELKSARTEALGISGTGSPDLRVWGLKHGP